MLEPTLALALCSAFIECVEGMGSLVHRRSSAPVGDDDEDDDDEDDDEDADDNEDDDINDGTDDAKDDDGDDNEDEDASPSGAAPGITNEPLLLVGDEKMGVDSESNDVDEVEEKAGEASASSADGCA
jgi:hypothetical protein